MEIIVSRETIIFFISIPRAMRVLLEVLLIEKQTSFDIMKLAWQLTTNSEEW